MAADQGEERGQVLLQLAEPGRYMDSSGWNKVVAHIVERNIAKFLFNLFFKKYCNLQSRHQPHCQESSWSGC